MAVVSGIGGSANIPDAVTSDGSTGAVAINIYKWTANVTREIYDASVFGSAVNWKTKVGGIADLQGTAEVWHDDTALAFVEDFTDLAAPAAGFTLVIGGVKKYSFTGLINSHQITDIKTGGLVVAVISFENSGAVTTVHA